MARLSLPKLVPIGPSPLRLVKWLGPFSNIVTCQPAWASTIAANEPPAPLPITMALVMCLSDLYTTPRSLTTSAMIPVVSTGSWPSERSTSSSV